MQRFADTPCQWQIRRQFLSLKVTHRSSAPVLGVFAICSHTCFFAAYFSSLTVVGTTCMNLSHAAFARRTFDYCIVDEGTFLVFLRRLRVLRQLVKSLCRCALAR
jgi:hypothetical protein